MARHYAVCYGHVCRWETASNPREAAKQAFGLIDTDQMTVRLWPSNPKYLSKAKKQMFLEPLYARHKEKTGSVIK